MAERFARLSPWSRQEVLRRAVEWGVRRGVQETLAYRGASGLSGLGQDTLASAVTVAVQNALKPLMPVVTDQLLAAVKPAAEKAAEIVGPAVGQVIEEKMPKYALIAGIVAAVLGLVGMVALGTYVVRKVR